MDIIIGSSGHPKKFNVPHSGHDEPNDDNAPQNAPFKFGRSEKLTDRQQVRDSRKRQRRHEPRSTPITEVARADR
jgi:hypothetical protein